MLKRQYDTSYHPQHWRVDFNTVNHSMPTGMDLLIHPCRWIDDEENVRTPPKLGRYCIRTLPRGGMYWEIHPLLDPRDFPRASPSGNLSGLGKSLGRRGWISQYLPRFGGARIQSTTWWFLWICWYPRITSLSMANWDLYQFISP